LDFENKKSSQTGLFISALRMAQAASAAAKLSATAKNIFDRHNLTSLKAG
jgi:hypothetical protein